ncbi:hypothetical protein QR680_004723 [Steinernema hermaphroditum]|uniref:Chondroitin proteoglycan 4 domain-containing protein n=1 Tax=Steinernema hermaphroditum TaxID=289476 RepID=A0AA39HRX1_9BILA|nr:hypothetical protein QR680_004723 [Steinernema hermaphroditum]
MVASNGRRAIFSLVIALQCAATFAQIGDQGKLSDCLKGCLRPLIKLDRSFTYQFLNFDKVCDTLEKAAGCQTRCSLEDQKAFYQFTSFFRLHCVEFEEELEEQMPCLRMIVSQVDKKCNSDCSIKSEKTMSKEQKMKATCKQVECNTLCYFENFSKHCPDAKDLLMRINVRQTQELEMVTPKHQIEKMEAECKNIHDLNYMKMKFVAI